MAPSGSRRGRRHWARTIEQRYRNSLLPGHFEAMQAPGLKNPATTRTAPPDPFLDQLAAVRTPMLLVEGRRDQLLETGWSKELATRAPAATAVETDYAHEPNIDAPAVLAELILPFLREK